jgi:hypothetical protein
MYRALRMLMALGRSGADLAEGPEAEAIPEAVAAPAAADVP